MSGGNVFSLVGVCFNNFPVYNFNIEPGLMRLIIPSFHLLLVRKDFQCFVIGSNEIFDENKNLTIEILPVISSMHKNINNYSMFGISF